MPVFYIFEKIRHKKIQFLQKISKWVLLLCCFFVILVLHIIIVRKRANVCAQTQDGVL